MEPDYVQQSRGVRRVRPDGVLVDTMRSHLVFGGDRDVAPHWLTELLLGSRQRELDIEIEGAERVAIRVLTPSGWQIGRERDTTLVHAEDGTLSIVARQEAESWPTI